MAFKVKVLTPSYQMSASLILKLVCSLVLFGLFLLFPPPTPQLLHMHFKNSVILYLWRGVESELRKIRELT